MRASLNISLESCTVWKTSHNALDTVRLFLEFMVRVSVSRTLGADYGSGEFTLPCPCFFLFMLYTDIWSSIDRSSCNCGRSGMVPVL